MERMRRVIPVIEITHKVDAVSPGAFGQRKRDVGLLPFFRFNKDFLDHRLTHL
jgi:hypothetical protein